MAGLWGIIVPEAGTNDILNPSAEATGNFAAHNSATVTRDTTQARFGDYAYKVVLGSTNRGLSLTTGALSNEAGYSTFYVYGTITGTLQVSQDAGANWNAAAVIGGSSGGWVRYGAAIPQAQRNGSTATLIRDTLNDGTLYIDAAMGQNVGYATTYIDGDQPGLYRWTGLRHGSTSTRDTQERMGGRERDLATDYGIRVVQYPGAGMPDLANNLQPLALQPGALFQSSRFLPRRLTLVSDIHQTTVPGFHSRRKALITLVSPVAKRGAQPFVLSYSGALSTKKVYGQFRYNDGLGLSAFTSGANTIEGGGKVNIGLIAVDPFWYEDNRETASLAFTAGAAKLVFGAKRVSGAWAKFGTGFDGEVRCFAYDKLTGRLYVGGDFTTANGVTVNRVCYWNGTTFVALDAGVGNNSVYALAVAPNGDLWVGGNFTAVGSGATTAVGLAKWSLAGAAWSVPTATATGTARINALAVDGTGNLYGGGAFSTIAGVANTVKIFKYDGSSFTALGTGITSVSAAVFALAWNFTTSLLYVGGSFTTANGVTVINLAYWNASTFVAVGNLAGGTPIESITVAPDGSVYVGGGFNSGAVTTHIAKWNGVSMLALGSGVNGDVFNIAISASGFLVAAGNFTSAGGLTATGLAYWNGFTWTNPDIADPSGGDLFTAAVFVGEDLYVGMPTNADNWNYAGLTTFTPSSTVTTFPQVTLIGGSSAGTTCLLQWLENQTTNERQYYNLTVQAGETVTIDARPDQTPVFSTWRGAIQNQPLMNSDDLRLLQDSNTLAAFISGTTTGVSLLMHWTPAHLSVDGTAA